MGGIIWGGGVKKLLLFLVVVFFYRGINLLEFGKLCNVLRCRGCYMLFRCCCGFLEGDWYVVIKEMIKR